MTPTIMQIIILVFVLFALSRVFLRWKAHEFGWREALFWTVIWIGVTVVVLIPSTVNVLSRALGLGGDPINALIYLSIVALFYLMYRIHVKQEKINHDLTMLVRTISLGKREK